MSKIKSLAMRKIHNAECCGGWSDLPGCIAAIGPVMLAGNSEWTNSCPAASAFVDEDGVTAIGIKL